LDQGLETGATVFFFLEAPRSMIGPVKNAFTSKVILLVASSGRVR
jgi:hypothetical protein